MDISLDSSGWTEAALTEIINAATLLSFGEAAEILSSLGRMSISGSDIARLFEIYSTDAVQHVHQELQSMECDPFEAPQNKPSRVMVFQADGVFVLGREKQAEGGCGMEIKTAVVYPQEAPTQRTRLATMCTATDFLPLCSGLLRQARVRVQDTLVAVTDGAPWLSIMCKTLPVSQHILDIYHSSTYISTVMEELGWDDKQQDAMRISWSRGEISGLTWLETYVQPNKDIQWSEKGKNAIAYLWNRVGMMDYPTYRSKGFPIGSGQIEGMNKYVIGSRMKSAGMRWSRSGAARMAVVRSQRSSCFPLGSVPSRRFSAFPRAIPKS